MAAALSHKLLLCILGADYKCKDSSGMCALDYILDYEEWMDCSHFNDDMRARLKGENYCVDASCPIQCRCLQDRVRKLTGCVIVVLLCRRL